MFYKSYLSPMAAELSKEFQRVAVDLDKHHSNVNIARLVAGTAGMIGAVTATLAMPVTGDLSAGLIGAGVLGTAGGLAATGSQLVELGIERVALKQVESLWKIFCKLYQEELQNDPRLLKESSRSLNAAIAENSLLAVKFSNELNAARSFVPPMNTDPPKNLFSKLYDMITRPSSMKDAPTRLAVSKVVTSVTNAALLGLSLWEVCEAIEELHKQKKSTLGECFRKMATTLDEIALDFSGYKAYRFTPEGRLLLFVFFLLVCAFVMLFLRPGCFENLFGAIVLLALFWPSKKKNYLS